MQDGRVDGAYAIGFNHTGREKLVIPENWQRRITEAKEIMKGENIDIAKW